MIRVRQRSGRRGLGLIGSAALTVAVAVLVAAGPASAQDDPYGSTSTTAGSPSSGASCELAVTSGDVGASVTATVQGVPLGEVVRILFGGTEVARATAPLQGQSGRAIVSIGFAVPAVSPGQYLVTAVGVGFTAVCSLETSGLFDVVDVLGSDISRSRGGGGSLARTGIYALLLVAIAVVLLLVGRALVEVSRRRRQAEWAARAGARRIASADHPGVRVTK